MLSEADLQREAAATGFRPEVLEKFIRLVELLEGLRSHPFLKPRIALKGGTARSTALDVKKLRIAFVVYGGINRRDWRRVSLETVKADPARVERELVPLLRARVAPAQDRVVEWTERLVEECRNLLSALLPLRVEETKFLDRLNERAGIAAEILTGDARLQAAIRSHPGLLWKALNVREHRDLGGRG
jgi:hypothetical protein